MQHQFKILALNEELQTVDGKQYTDVSASNYSKFELNLWTGNQDLWSCSRIRDVFPAAAT